MIIIETRQDIDKETGVYRLYRMFDTTEQLEQFVNETFSNIVSKNTSNYQQAKQLYTLTYQEKLTVVLVTLDGHIRVTNEYFISPFQHEKEKVNELFENLKS